MIKGRSPFTAKQAQKKRSTLNPEKQLGKAMQIEIQLDEERARKLEYIQQQTQQNAAEVLEQAIDQYYQQIQPPETDPLAKLKQSKFIGCFQGPPDLSVNSKAYFHEIMQKKFPQQHPDQ